LKPGPGAAIQYLIIEHDFKLSTENKRSLKCMEYFRLCIYQYCHILWQKYTTTGQVVRYQLTWKVKMLKYISGDCGSAKTYVMIEMIKRTNIPYLVVHSELQLMKQSVAALGDICTVISSETHSNVEEAVNIFSSNLHTEY
jgi:hypothetical protein